MVWYGMVWHGKPFLKPKNPPKKESVLSRFGYGWYGYYIQYARRVVGFPHCGFLCCSLFQCYTFTTLRPTFGSIYAFWFDILVMATNTTFDARGYLVWTSLGIISFLRSLCPGLSLGSSGGTQPRMPMLTGSSGTRLLDGRRRDRGLGFTSSLS